MLDDDILSVNYFSYHCQTINDFLPSNVWMFRWVLTQNPVSIIAQSHVFRLKFFPSLYCLTIFSLNCREHLLGQVSLQKKLLAWGKCCKVNFQSVIAGLLRVLCIHEPILPQQFHMSICRRSIFPVKCLLLWSCYIILF